MTPARKTSTEAARQAAVDALRLDASEETAYDDITRLAAQTFDVPIALITIVDGDRQWFKSRVGTQATETPREIAFCATAVDDPLHVLVVEDAASDARFRSNPLVTGEPHIRFYAGAPLVASSGHAIGTVCVIDTQPRRPDATQLETLRFLAQQVITRLEETRRLSADESTETKET